MPRRRRNNRVNKERPKCQENKIPYRPSRVYTLPKEPCNALMKVSGIENNSIFFPDACSNPIPIFRSFHILV